jgi:ArsR family transcriptional regulator, arsenate/arsenite/antimonite-responsive transcriptional repressor
MDVNSAIDALAALAQETRLAVFRLLVREGPEGLPAGVIAERLGIPAPTLSFHLNQLSAAELVVGRRDGRSMIYAVNFAGMRDLLGFLVEDCCGGRPELCAPALASGEAAPSGCAPARRRAKAC